MRSRQLEIFFFAISRCMYSQTHLINYFIIARFSETDLAQPELHNNNEILLTARIFKKNYSLGILNPSYITVVAIFYRRHWPFVIRLDNDQKKSFLPPLVNQSSKIRQWDTKPEKTI